MSTMIKGLQARAWLLGNPPVSKATGTLAASTVALFTVTGGMVVVTSLVGKVTTAISVANNYRLQYNPTTGTTVDLAAATDLGSVDTAVGDLLVPQGASGIVRGVGVTPLGFVLDVGQIEHVSTGTDGAITWHATWYPYEDGASLAAA